MVESQSLRGQWAQHAQQEKGSQREKPRTRRERVGALEFEGPPGLAAGTGGKESGGTFLRTSGMASAPVARLLSACLGEVQRQLLR